MRRTRAEADVIVEVARALGSRYSRFPAVRDDGAVHAATSATATFLFTDIAGSTQHAFFVAFTRAEEEVWVTVRADEP